MTIAFADSSFYVALIIARDANHIKARAAAESWAGSVVTTEYVLIEVANHLGRTPKQRKQVGQLVADLEVDPNTEIVESSPNLWKRGLSLYLQRTDKEWSLTDCISFVVMQDRAVTQALTTDHHFEQAGFTVLLKP